MGLGISWFLRRIKLEIAKLCLAKPTCLSQTIRGDGYAFSRRFDVHFSLIGGGLPVNYKEHSDNQYIARARKARRSAPANEIA
jgi:hypothetical protein